MTHISLEGRQCKAFLIISWLDTWCRDLHDVQVRPFWDQDTADSDKMAYPMDYYAREGGPWNSHWKPKSKRFS